MYIYIYKELTRKCVLRPLWGGQGQTPARRHILIEERANNK